MRAMKVVELSRADRPATVDTVPAESNRGAVEQDSADRPAECLMAPDSRPYEIRATSPPDAPANLNLVER